MADRIRTLVLWSDGLPRVPKPHNALDTASRRMRRFRRGIKAGLGRAVPVGVSRLFAARFDSLSYTIDWADALRSAPELDVKLCNIDDFEAYRKCRPDIVACPLVIVLHSANGAGMGLLRHTSHWFDGRRGTLAVFIRNEYEHLDKKIRFLQEVGADFICSQLPLATAQWLYAPCTASRVLPTPHALNPDLYRPGEHPRRNIDIGFRGDLYSFAIGDIERTSVIEHFRKHGPSLGLSCDIKVNRRLPRRAWAGFLCRCRGTIGAESGSYFLDRSGAMIREAADFVKRHPQVPFQEIFELFFRSTPVNYRCGKCISSRHFEPVGAKACQLLVEGRYNGILKADEHYIALRKDLSNVDDAVARFQDVSYRTAVAERAYEFVMDRHTYRQRVADLIEDISRCGPHAADNTMGCGRQVEHARLSTACGSDP